MFFTKIRRMFRAGFVNFWRNGFVSIASVMVLTVTLFVIGSMVFMRAGLTSALSELKQRVDINVYFVTTADESDILALQKSLSQLPEVASVTYTSRDDALAQFKARHQDDQLALQALDELSDNPLGASLNIRATDPSQYGAIADFLQGKNALSSKDGTSIIESNTYFKNQQAIDKLTRIINTTDQAGLLIAIVLIGLSVLDAYNTVRLGIYSAREEIAVMKLVGASNTHIRGPFVVTGIMGGVIAALLALVIFWPVSVWFGPKLANFFGSVDLASWYMTRLWKLALLLIGSGAAIGAVSSFIAIRRHLRV